jgi:hypothetical protein
MQIHKKSTSDVLVNSVSTQSPPAKRYHTSLFGYSRASSVASTNDSPEKQLMQYMNMINNTEADINVLRMSDFHLLKPLFLKFLCVPATSAPVERVFSHGGLLMKPNRSRMTPKVLETLVMLRCNDLK